MFTTAELATLLVKSIDGDPWHGSSALALLEDVTARQAASRPIANGHTICEIVLHVSAWHGEVERRLGGAAPADPTEGDWPAPGDQTEERWRLIRDDLLAGARSLARRVETTGADVWPSRVGGERSREAGTGVTHAEMLLGVLQHDAYHAGQIGLLRKLVAGA